MSIQPSSRLHNTVRTTGVWLLLACGVPTQTALALECSAAVLVQESRGSWEAQDGSDGPTVRIVSLPEDSHLRVWGLQPGDRVERVSARDLGCQWTVARGSNPQPLSLPVHPTLAPGEVDTAQIQHGRWLLNGNYSVNNLVEFISGRLMLPATHSCASHRQLSFVSRSSEPWDTIMPRVQSALESVGCTMTITDRAVVVRDLVVDP